MVAGCGGVNMKVAGEAAPGRRGRGTIGVVSVFCDGLNGWLVMAWPFAERRGSR
jgi:hypothetical protein